MATKSKNYKYHICIKLLCYILSFTFAFLSAYNCVLLLRKSIFYAGGSFKESISFADAINSDMSKLYGFTNAIEFYTEDMTYDDFCKTDAAKKIEKEYKEKTDRALKIYALIQDLKKLEPEESRDVYEDEFYEDEYVPEESYYEEDYTAASVLISDYSDNPDDKELFTIKPVYTSHEDWEGKYHQLRLAIFRLVDDATSEDTIKGELEENKEHALYTYYEDNVIYIRNTLNKFINIQFILKDNKTGNVISNVPKAERKNFINNISKDNLFYINFNGKKLLSPEMKTASNTSTLKFLTEIDAFNSSIIDNDYMTGRFKGCTVYLKLTDKVVPGDGFYNQVKAFETTNKGADYYKANTIIFAILSLCFIILSCSMAGKTKDNENLLTRIDKTPFIIELIFTVAFLVLFGAGAFFGAVLDAFPYYGDFNELIWLITEKTTVIFTSLCVGFFSVSILNFALYIAKNTRAGKLSNRFLTVFIVKKITGVISKHKQKAFSLKKMHRHLVFALIGYVIINAVFIVVLLSEALIPVAVAGLVIFNTLCVVYTALYLSDVTRLSAIAEQIRNGSLDTEIRPNTFVKPLRPFAVNLSDCRDSIQIAIDNALKGEHLKTELITNVSHDLKTPLTSIINYVSLLKLCNIDNDDAKSYIEILDDKSKKLKRLIEDLTEASKATSGNIKMKKEIVNLNELALQAVGENSDVLEKAGLDVIITEQDSNIIVTADSQHTFRVIDNLFSNVRKYSLSGTRVYVDVFMDGNYGAISVKNISRDKLNLTPEELTERFVRGDNSRTTDGSGLGLSIAQNFTRLQNGIFSLDIDGDMFKVTVKLPIATNLPPQ